MKIRTLGNGYIASCLPYEVLTDRIFSDPHAIRQMLDYHKPDVLINCVGRCGTPNIDYCETHQAETATANTSIPIVLATECEKLGIRLIHIGSGCIYAGRSPHCEEVPKFGLAGGYTEDTGWQEIDTANPQSYYAKTKYATDLAIGSLSNTTILRIRMPIGSKPHPRNFINKVLGYKQVINEPNSMTFVDDLARCISWVIEGDKRGIWHVANPGTLTAVDVAMEYRKYKASHMFDVISTETLDKMTAAKRSNCVLDCSKLTSAGFQFDFETSKIALRDYMANYVRTKFMTSQLEQQKMEHI